MTDVDLEANKRDQALENVASAVDNNYELIYNAAYHWLVHHVDPGRMLVSGEIFKAVMMRHPELHPREKRVMGAVMKRLQRDRLIRPAGISNRERSHCGMSREWIRT